MRIFVHKNNNLCVSECVTFSRNNTISLSINEQKMTEKKKEILSKKEEVQVAKSTMFRRSTKKKNDEELNRIVTRRDRKDITTHISLPHVEIVLW